MWNYNVWLAFGSILFLSGIFLIYLGTASSTGSLICGKFSTENCAVIPVDGFCSNLTNLACGSFLIKKMKNKTKIKSDSTTIDLKFLLSSNNSLTDSTGINFAKDLYKYCMDNETRERQGIQPILDVIKSYGGWPVIEGQNWNEKNWDWADTIAKMSNDGFEGPSILDFNVGQLKQNKSDYKLCIKKPLFTMNYEQLSENHIPYHNFMVDVAVSFGANKSLAKIEMARVLTFQMELAKNALPANGMEWLTNSYKSIKIREMQMQHSYIDWMKFIRSVLPQEVAISVDYEVELEMSEYFEFLEFTLKRTHKRTIANYLIWHIVSHSLEFLNAESFQRKIVALESIGQKPQQSTLDDQCFDYVKRYLSTSLGYLYIHENSRKITKARAVTIEVVNNIRNEFIETLQAVEWIHGEAKDQAIEKVKFMNIIIGYPDDHHLQRDLKQFYDGLELIPNNFYRSFLRISAYNNLSIFRRYLTQSVLSDLSLFCYIQDSWLAFARYDWDTNSVCVSVARLLLHWSFNDTQYYKIYATIGVIIAHEIAHGFGISTYTLDRFGNKVHWPEETAFLFVSKLLCFMRQFSEVITEQGDRLDGEKTLNENIADNIGIKVAYKAYQKFMARNGSEPLPPGLETYTQQQLFWISLAQGLCYQPENMRQYIQIATHTPDRYRVEIALKNIPEFAKDFNCSSESPMSLAEPDRCNIF